MFSVDKSTMSRNIELLVASGFVLRLTNREDRRYVQIMLLDDGNHLYTQINQSMEDYFASVLAQIAPEKIKTVKEGIIELILI